MNGFDQMSYKKLTKEQLLEMGIESKAREMSQKVVILCRGCKTEFAAKDKENRKFHNKDCMLKYIQHKKVETLLSKN